MMMVVVGDLFAQFVVGMLVTHRDLADQTGVFENGEVPVDRTLRKRRLLTQDHRDGDRTTGVFQRPKNELSTSRESLAVLAKAVERDVINISCHEHTVYIMHGDVGIHLTDQATTSSGDVGFVYGA